MKKTNLLIVSLLFSALFFTQCDLFEDDKNKEKEGENPPTPTIPPPATKQNLGLANGPFVLYEDDAQNPVRLITGYSDGTYSDIKLPELRFVEVESNDLAHKFKVDIHEPVTYHWNQDKPAKVFVASDFHGQLEAFVDLMRNNGIMDENYNWSYGQNNLVVIGDTFDRGRNELPIHWLLYKLEQQADQAGGRVHYLIGNHDDMVLRNSLTYVIDENFAFAELIGLTMPELYELNTEIGKWLRSRKIMIVIGGDLYVHAGIYHEFLNYNYSIDEINDLWIECAGLGTNAKIQKNPRAEHVFNSSTSVGGVLWFRGMSSSSSSYNPASDEQIQMVLDHYDINRVIVGHTEVSEINWRYNGKVIAVNVAHKTNHPANRSGALVIEGDKYYSVKYSGDVHTTFN